MYFLLKCSAVKLNLMSKRQVKWTDEIQFNYEKMWIWNAGVKGVQFLLTVELKMVTPGKLKNTANFGWGQSRSSDWSPSPRQPFLSSSSFHSHHFMNSLLEAVYCVTVKILFILLFFIFFQSINNFIGLLLRAVSLSSWAALLGNWFWKWLFFPWVYVNAIFHLF